MDALLKPNGIKWATEAVSAATRELEDSLTAARKERDEALETITARDTTIKRLRKMCEEREKLITTQAASIDKLQKDLDAANAKAEKARSDYFHFKYDKYRPHFGDIKNPYRYVLALGVATVVAFVIGVLL